MIRVYKFGGASVKDAQAVKNVAQILTRYADANTVVVVSAMGKSTNALEKILKLSLNGDYAELNNRVDELYDYHSRIASELFVQPDAPVFEYLKSWKQELRKVVAQVAQQKYDIAYDAVVSFGELISTKIVAEYLKIFCNDSQWMDAREMIFTDNRHRDAYINWALTEQMIQNKIGSFFEGKEKSIVITQGFIGMAIDGMTSTLGREGSDFSAAILAYCLKASDVTIWKDVPGILNADPKLFPDAVMLNHISYREAVELTYYGASVIHPKTIKPLENARIQLRVKSFVSPSDPGSLIDAHGHDDAKVPSYIIKFNQILLSLHPKDFSFINEENLSSIFSVFAEFNIRIRLMQNSAISFSLCFDHDDYKLSGLIERLQQDFTVRYNENVELITIRHYNEDSVVNFLKNKKLLMEQRSRATWQMITKKI